MATITSARALGEQFRAMLADIKKEIDATTAEMSQAIGDLKDTAGQAKEMVKAVKAETADLRASLGLHTNNPPAE